MADWYYLTANDITVKEINHTINTVTGLKYPTEVDVVFSEYLLEFFEQYGITTASIIQTRLPESPFLLKTHTATELYAITLRRLEPLPTISIEQQLVDFYGLIVSVSSDHDIMMLKLAWDGR